MKNIKQQIHNLRKKLSKWQYKYHTKNKSEVSDLTYDTLLEKLKQLELDYPDCNVKNSPTQSIGSITQSGFRRICHKVPMLSLNSTINQSQLFLFDKRIKSKLNYNNHQNITYCCELKIDGVAISLLYKYGKLIQATTRGDGKIGEDVTKNAYMIRSIPVCLKLQSSKTPYLLEVRGEIFILKSHFLQLNKSMLNRKHKLFSNSRNAASGSLRQLDAKVTALRPLHFCCYGISYYIGDQLLPNSHWDRLQLCKDWGMKINSDTQLVYGINDTLKFYDCIKKIRSNLEYDIDGVVIKVDNCNDQNQLSYNARSPNWAIAYKFPAESQYTKLNKIIFKVGRTGLIIPIACIDPIVINSVYIKKVNLYNINEITRLNLIVGDTVLVQRSGDVIPKIIKVIESSNINFDQSIKIPQYCPVCRSVLKSWKNKSLVLYCTAKLTCLAQRKAMLNHFVSRKAMNINGIGVKLIDQLVNENLIHTPVDFFYLNIEKLCCLDGFGMRSAERLLQSIDAAKLTTLSRFIYALSIPNVGEVSASCLANFYKNIKNLIIADLNSLMNVNNIGTIGALGIYDFFRNSNNLKNIQDLIHPDVGITLDIIE